jgi:putative membrane protein
MQNATTVLLIVLAVLIALPLIGGLAMMGFGMMGFGIMGPAMMNGPMAGYASGFSPLRVIFGLAVWAVVIGGVTLVVVYFLRNAKLFAPSGEQPLDILKARYARGEITKEQFDAIKRDLET